MEIKDTVKVAGRYRLQVIRPDGTVKRGTGWFKNLITNGGLDALGDNGAFGRYCQVGSGNTAPSNTDSSLVSLIATTQTADAAVWGYSTDVGAAASSPYYQYQRLTYTFGTGVAAGNISEVGIGWATSGSLFSRALILDSYGDPTTITVLSDEQLIVTYEFRYYPIETDQTGNVTFTGNLGGTYAWTLRPALITTVKEQLTGIYTYRVACPMNLATGYNNTMYASAGAIAIITSQPSGVGSNAISSSAGSYTPGSYTITLTLSASTAQANINISSMMVLWGPSCIQLGFSPAIPKTSSDTLSITLTRSWDRL